MTAWRSMRERGGREVGEVVGYYHLGAASPCGGNHVPVVGVGKVDRRDEFLPLGHECVGERDPHLPEQAG